MAIRHIVLFEANEDAAEKEVSAAFEECGKLISQIPGVTSFVGGPTVNPNTAKRVYGFSMEFDTMETLSTYVQHENHSAALEVIRPYNKTAMSCQLEV